MSTCNPCYSSVPEKLIKRWYKTRGTAKHGNASSERERCQWTPCTDDSFDSQSCVDIILKSD